MEYSDTGRFSQLFLDYINQKPTLKELVEVPLNSFDIKTHPRFNQFPSENRKVLVNVLQEQHDALGLVNDSIKLLEKEDTYTVTTGHQLNIFGGPLFILYKVLTAIRLAKKYEDENPGIHVVPIFWLATEDHDFEEIRTIELFNKKVGIDCSYEGPVGQLSADNIQTCLNEVKNILGESSQALKLSGILQEAYTSGNLASATMKLWYALLPDFNFIIIDACHPRLKALASDVFKEELLQQTSFDHVSQTAKKLEQLGYPVQAPPSEVNMFWMSEGSRLKIEKNEVGFKIGDRQVSSQEMEQMIEQQPEVFSPNVIMRPIYQEKILPNLVYVGGPGEIAYWLELKSAFGAYNVPMPLIYPRASFGLVDARSVELMNKYDVGFKSLMEDVEGLIRDRFIEDDVDLSSQIGDVRKALDKLSKSVTDISKGRAQMAEAFSAKTMNEVEKLKDLVEKDTKKKHDKDVKQMRRLFHDLFPVNSLQERETSLLEYWLKTEGKVIPQVYNEISIPDLEFRFITLQ